MEHRTRKPEHADSSVWKVPKAFVPQDANLEFECRRF